ncbi:YhcN/YlaJ family sporulation lipoprotein [Virgibacillus oceani]
MAKLMIIPFSLLLIFIAGCADTAEEETRMNRESPTQPIHYESEREQKDRLNVRDQSIGERGGYPQSKLDNINDADFEGGYSDEYTTERTEEITDYLKRKQEIIQAQVAETDERIVIAVMTPERPNHDTDISGAIKEEVENILPGTDKEIVVYTDDAYWERMKNIDARWKARETGEDIGEMLENFFNIDDD